MKKLSTILLLCVMVQYTFGLYTVYLWNSFTIRQSMKAAIASGSFRHSQVHTFTVSLQGASAAEAGYWQQDEIAIAGKMYDVVSTTQKGHQIILQCICDDDETGLMNAFVDATNNRHRNMTNSNVGTLAGFFSPFVITDIFILHRADKWTTIALLPSGRRKASINTNKASVPTPPPRLA